MSVSDNIKRNREEQERLMHEENGAAKLALFMYNHHMIGGDVMRNQLVRCEECGHGLDQGGVCPRH